MSKRTLLLSHVILAFVSFSAMSSASAQEILDISRVVKMPAEGVTNPKQDLFNKAIEDVTFEHVKALIGEDKTTRNEAAVKNRVLPQSGKFVLSIRGDNPTKKDLEYQMSVSMKMSLRGLRQVLLEQGLLYKTEGAPKILPVVHFVDRVGVRSYGWWFQEANQQNKFLVDQTELLHKRLRDEFSKLGFFSLDPNSGRYSASLPEVFRTESLSRADYLFMGEYFKSSVVLRGNVTYRSKPETENVFIMDVKLEALHSSNGRLMAEVVRSFETESGSFRAVAPKMFNTMASRVAEDMGAQLTEAWKRGTFGASLLKLAVVGKVEPKTLEDFKKDVILKVRDIKSLRERHIEANRTVYEVDSSALPQELAEAMRTATFGRLKLQIEEVSSSGLTIKVQSL